MARYFIAAILLLSTSSLPAQDTGFVFGARVGANLSGSTLKVDHYTGKSVKFGFQAGATVDYNFSKVFFLQSGLSLSTKGAKFERNDTSIGGPVSYIHGESTVDQVYVQMPLFVGYRIEVSPTMNAFANAGPYVAYGIGGKAVTDNTYSGSRDGSDKEKTDTFGERALKEFDYGLSAGIGVEFGKITMSLNYELGLANIGRDDAGWSWVTWSSFYDDSTYKNRNTSVVVGYKFAR